MLVVAPPAVIGSTWLNRFGDYQTASVSGWMAIRGIKRRRGVDRGFVLSDHADFEGLTNAISQTGASRVFLTHGYTAQFAKWLSESCTEVEATELQSQYSDDLEE